MVGYSVVVVSARLNSMGSQYSISLLGNLCSKSVGHNILDHGIYLLFNTDTVNCENR